MFCERGVVDEMRFDEETRAWSWNEVLAGKKKTHEKLPGTTGELAAT